MRTAFAFLLLSIATVGVIAEPSAPPTERQEVDLRVLEIEGDVPYPSTLFIRERNGDLLLELFTLRRILSEGWLIPIDKNDFDIETLYLVECGER